MRARLTGRAGSSAPAREPRFGAPEKPVVASRTPETSQGSVETGVSRVRSRGFHSWPSVFVFGIRSGLKTSFPGPLFQTCRCLSEKPVRG